MALKVLIVGASIAGPSAAYWFARAGADVTVIERFPKFREGGQNIDIRSVGVTVMRKTPGLEEMIKSKLYKIDGFQFVDGNDNEIATLLATGDSDHQSMVSEYEILRGDLAHIYYDLTKDKVKYIFNEQLSAMQQHPDKVDVTFESGRIDTFDLVVAADGATSRTRAIALECGVRDHIKSMNAWAAYFTTKKDLTGTNMGKAFSKVPGLFVALGPNSTGNKCIIMRMYSQQNGTLPFREAQKGDFKGYVKEQLQGQGWKCEDIVKSLIESDDLYGSELVQVKVPTLSKRRFVMIGDAGHATGPTGTGTSLAMTAAYLLAGEVMQAGDVICGLAAYEKKMTSIIKDLSVIPPGVPGFMAPQTEWGTYVRNTMLQVVAFGSRYAKYFYWVNGIFGNAFGDKDKYDIPDYEWPIAV